MITYYIKRFSMFENKEKHETISKYLKDVSNKNKYQVINFIFKFYRKHGFDYKAQIMNEKDLSRLYNITMPDGDYYTIIITMNNKDEDRRGEINYYIGLAPDFVDTINLNDKETLVIFKK